MAGRGWLAGRAGCRGAGCLGWLPRGCLPQSRAAVLAGCGVWGCAGGRPAGRLEAAAALTAARRAPRALREAGGHPVPAPPLPCLLPPAISTLVFTPSPRQRPPAPPLPPPAPPPRPPARRTRYPTCWRWCRWRWRGPSRSAARAPRWRRASCRRATSSPGPWDSSSRTPSSRRCRGRAWCASRCTQRCRAQGELPQRQLPSLKPLEPFLFRGCLKGLNACFRGLPVRLRGQRRGGGVPTQQAGPAPQHTPRHPCRQLSAAHPSRTHTHGTHCPSLSSAPPTPGACPAGTARARWTSCGGTTRDRLPT